MKVMFATDGSEYAAKAAGILAKAKALSGMDLRIVTVTYDPDDPTSDAARPWYDEYRRAIDERVQSHYLNLKDLIQNAAKTVQMSHLRGSPAHEILEAVKRHKPDLLVLGAKGHSMLERILLGSVSESVAFQADCSVLVLRPADVEDDSAGDIRRVTLAYDGSARAQAAAAEISQLKWSKNTEVDVVTVETPPATYSELGMPMVQPIFHQQELEAKLDAFCEQLPEHLHQVSPRLISDRHIGEAIVQHAESTDADLIVLGDSGHGSLERLLLGSTSRYVLRNANCSVWISKAATVETAEETSDSGSETSKLKYQEETVDRNLEIV